MPSERDPARPVEAHLWPQLRVVQAGDSAACGFAAKLLVDLGADCILVEDPGNATGSGAPEAERTFLHWAKRSTVRDEAADGGLELLARLCGSADILIRDGLPAPLRGRWAAMRAERAPRLIELVVTPFGESGPYADYRGDNGAVQALAGLAYTNGDPDHEPLITQPNVAEYFAGAEGLVAIMAALTWRSDSGQGCSIDLSMLDSAVAFDEHNLILPPAFGVVRKRYYSRVIHGYPSDVFECRDGHLILLAGGRFDQLPLLMGRPDLIDEPVFLDAGHRAEHWPEIEELLVPWCRARDRDEIIERAQELRIRAAPVLGIAELVDHEHVRHRHSVRRAHDAHGEVVRPAAPFRLRSYAPRAEPAPRRGEHTMEIRSALGQAKQPWRKARGDSSRRPRQRGSLPLSGIRVLDFTHVWAGPACTRILADLGAEVIKLEGPSRIDLTRSIFLVDNDSSGDYWERSLYFQNRNQGKRHIAVDLAREEGRKLVRRLVAKCDVVVENFTPRVMPAFGLDYAALSAVQPQLVMVAMSGYGASGPFADHTALGMSLDGSCGLSSGNGYAGGPPAKCGTAILDPFAGVCAAAGVMAALLEREQSGEGQFVDFSQHEAGMSLVGPWIVEHSRSAREPERRGNRSERDAPQGIYPCEGDDQWLYLSVRSDEEWRRCCAVLGDPALGEDERFGTSAGRLVHHDELDERLGALTALREKRALMDALQAVGVIAAAVLDGAEVLADPQLAARGAFELVALGDPPREVPSQRYLPAKFDAFTPPPAAPAARLGEHNRELLQELCGLSGGEYAALERSGVIATKPLLALPIEEMRAAVRSPLESWLAQGQVRRAP